jgi:phage repressor protein C with HTH and peptisase S24 domain
LPKSIKLILSGYLTEQVWKPVWNNVPHGTEGGNHSTELEETGSPKKKTFREELREKKNIPKQFMVPLVPVRAQAGYARSFDSSEFIERLDLYPILPGIDPRGAVWRYFEIQGDSMEPGLYDSDLVLVSMVPPEDWGDLKKGQVYVIVTADNVLIKQIYPHDKENWILTSSNKRHKQKLIAIRDIREVWLYRRHVTNKIKLEK